ncbi:hypothetical protein KFE25_008675 [Diacronema lutheri]|uniref:Uncharacterized protein n=2 Tax=Diacronema lutheri TaxID=2081491 RepID=A0A8J5Y2Y2_DIALT|nr:hypothetical protein KFE25_008675 [Diacronema lutheri]
MGGGVVVVPPGEVQRVASRVPTGGAQFWSVLTGAPASGAGAPAAGSGAGAPAAGAPAELDAGAEPVASPALEPTPAFVRSQTLNIILPRADSAIAMEPLPMMRARPLSEGDGPYVETPHEVRLTFERMALELPALRVPQQPSRMLTLDESEKENHEKENHDARRQRRTALANRIGKLFAIVCALAALIGGIAYFVRDSDRSREGSRLNFAYAPDR